MTTMTLPCDVAHPTPERFQLARRITGYAAIAGIVPYLTLKLAWLTGNDVGVLDPAFMHDRTIFALNLFTAGMDLYAILLALTFAYAWRMPAPLVLFPIWVGTGFLAPILAGVPVVGLVTAVAGPGGHASSGPTLPLEPWVQPLVYGGFAWQGSFLLTGFLLYAAVRWRGVFTARLAETAARWAPAGYAGAVLAGLAGGLHLAQAFGSGLGITAAQAAARTPTTYAVEAIHGVAAFAAAAGILILVRRAPSGWRLRVAVVLAWVGAGAMFSWGFWSLVNIVGATLLSSGTTTVELLAVTAQTLGGLLLAATLVATASTVLRRGTAGDAHHEQHQTGGE
jgi:hypothetical protein